MIVTILDANGIPRNVVLAAQGTPTDLSGTIAATGVSQVLAPLFSTRAGWLLQNLSQSGNAMRVSELGADATLAGTFSVDPGQTFPPPGYPVPVGTITVAGTAGDAFTAREW